jgi:porin
MIYDPVSVVNRSGLSRPFAEGVTLRASVDFPVTLAGRSGHQGFSATYGTQDGTDLSRLGDLLIPPGNGAPVPIKENRYHVAYSFDQFLFQARENAKEGCGLFGQLAFSDGNPNPLDWSAVIGVGGTGLIPGRAQDRWGSGFFHYSVSSALKRSVNAAFALDDEQGAEIFYNAALTPWLSVAADLQVIDPAQSRRATAVVFGLRTSVKF